VEICHEIKKRREPSDQASNVQRAVLVFFDSAETLRSFESSHTFQSMKLLACSVTEEASSSERNAAVLRATEKGAVTLLIREYGRGTDFRCFDKRMLDAGGVHIIQAFFSVEPSEQIQVMARGARQGKDGSYRYVFRFTR